MWCHLKEFHDPNGRVPNLQSCNLQYCAGKWKPLPARTTGLSINILVGHKLYKVWIIIRHQTMNFCLWWAVLIQHVGFLEIQTILRVSPLWYSLTQQCWNTFVIIELTHWSSVVPLSQLILPRVSACSDIPSGVRQRRATRCAPTCSPPTPTPSVKLSKTSCFISSIWTASPHLHG